MSPSSPSKLPIDTAGASPTRQSSRDPVTGRAFSTMVIPALSRTSDRNDGPESPPVPQAAESTASTPARRIRDSLIVSSFHDAAKYSATAFDTR